jgi:hypothetical protein
LQKPSGSVENQVHCCHVERSLPPLRDYCFDMRDSSTSLGMTKRRVSLSTKLSHLIVQRFVTTSPMASGLMLRAMVWRLVRSLPLTQPLGLPIDVAQLPLAPFCETPCFDWRSPRRTPPYKVLRSSTVSVVPLKRRVPTGKLSSLFGDTDDHGTRSEVESGNQAKSHLASHFSRLCKPAVRHGEPVSPQANGSDRQR